MENASKALLIAGGVLLAMMILSLVVIMTSSLTDISEGQDRKKLTEQIEEFNKSYLAYNKTRMYGTDVITVVNKAIDHNRTVDAREEDPYYINIYFETKSDFKTEGKVINTELPSDDKNYEKEADIGDIKRIMGISDITIALNAGTYNLGSWNSDGTIQMNSGIIQFFKQEKNDITKKEGKKIYYLYSALTNFKRAIFECTDVDYSDDGRIKEMTFKQK